MNIILKDFNEVIVQNPEPYKSIYEFISSNIIPKYSCLTSCYQDNFDEEGNPRVQYYIRYAEKLSMGEWDELFISILSDIEDFCTSSGISYGEELAVDFILTVDGNFNAK